MQTAAGDVRDVRDVWKAQPAAADPGGRGFHRLGLSDLP